VLNIDLKMSKDEMALWRKYYFLCRREGMDYIKSARRASNGIKAKRYKLMMEQNFSHIV